MGLTYNIDARVEILPAYTSGKDILSDPLALNYPQIKAQLQADVQSVTVANSIRQPAGTFTITLPPREVVSGYGWADLIRPYSLVTISLHRYGDRSDPATTPEPEPIMMGLVDHVALSEDYGSVAPRRSVQVTGRSLAALLTDIKWWYHHLLQKPDAIPPDLRQFYQAPAPSIELLRDEVGLRGLGFLAIANDLWESLPDRHPVAAMARAYDFFVNGLDGRAPFIKLQFQDGRALSSRLLFQSEAAQASFFDSGARLLQHMLPSSMPQATCWDLMAYFSEPPFVEAFTDTFGATAADAAVYVRVRKPPWLGHIGPAGKIYFSNGAESPPVWGQSLFDTTYGEWDLSLDTVEIDGSDIIARPSLRRGLLGPEIFSAYEIRPQIGSAAGDNRSDKLLQEEVPPLLEEQVDVPSNIYRYGIRPLIRTTKYVPTAEGDDRTARSYTEQALAYQALARTWFMWGPEFWSGQYTCKGRTAFRAGRRLYDYDVRREFYITAVVHRVDLASPQPLYTTALTVERGWDVTP